MHLKRTVEDLWRAFDVQKAALEVSIYAFDHGMKGETARLANSVFLLVGRGMKSHKSILDQLLIQDRVDFCTTTSNSNLVYAMLTSMGSDKWNIELVHKGISDARLVKFKEWWSENVMRHGNDRELCRAQIIRILRDKDGGTHFQ